MSTRSRRVLAAAIATLGACSVTLAQLAPAVPEAAPESLITSERLMQTLRSLPAKRASWTDDAGRAGLRKTERLIVERLKALGYAPELDPVDAIGTRSRPEAAPEAQADPNAPDPAPPWNNIVVDIPGVGVPGEVLVFSAHIDAVADSPGADDDGSGTAALLEAARVLSGRSMQRTVRLIFFNLEEVGLVGSRAYTQRLKEALDAGRERVVGMASLDGIGFYTDTPDSQKSPLPPLPGFTPPTVGDFLAIGGVLRHRMFSQALARAMRESEPRLKLVVVDMLPLAPPDLLRSDHAPFLALGAPAVIATDTANFRSPHYHKSTDTIETIDVDRFTLAARGVAGAIYRLAGPPGTALVELIPPARPAVKPVPRPEPTPSPNPPAP